MAGQNITPIIPNLSNQDAAVAGSQAVVFTATDRKVIEERGGNVEQTRSFLDVFKDKPLTPQVENEETNIKPEFSLQEFEGRIKDHKKSLKHSVIINPQDKVLLTNTPPDSYEVEATPDLAPEPVTQKADEAIAVKEPKPMAVNQSPSDVFDQLAIEQNKLNEVRGKVKRYHLERLLTDNEQEFNRLSAAIKETSLATAAPTSKEWLGAQLDQITSNTAEYKLKLLLSLDNLEQTNHQQTIAWLKRNIDKLS
jgi:hypothetical protein